MYLLSWGATAAAAFYGTTIIYGIAAGYALPPATLFALFPAAHLISDIEPFLPWFLLGIAVIGALCGWAAAAGLLSTSELQAQERRLVRFWSYAGFPVILLLFLFAMSGGGWSGRFVTVEQNYQSLAGLVPHSDAVSYFSDAFDLAYTGHWDSVASQRPFAAAFRNLAVFAGGMSYVGTLLVQAVLTAGGIIFALRSAVAWRGIWVGMALFALLYGLARPFLLTTLTEPLGLVWSLISLSFFIEALRRPSVAMAVVAFAALACGLFTRMGSMFTVPFLIVWIALSFAGGRALRVRALAALTCVLLVIVIYNAVLAYAFSAPEGHIGGNFSWVVCGLAHGTDYVDCYKMIMADHGSVGDWGTLYQFAYAEALRAFIADPTVLIKTLLHNLWGYLIDIPQFLLTEYATIAYIRGRYIFVFILLLIPGWIYTLKGEAGRLTLSFGLVLLVSTALSAAVVFGNDGRRVMHVTYPFMAILFAIGFSAPVSLRRPDDQPMLSWRLGAHAIVAVMLAFLAGPPLIGALIRKASVFDPTVEADRADVRIVPGGKFITGLLVLPDTTHLPREVPAMHVSTFAQATKIYGDSEPYLSEMFPRVPFALIYSPAQNYPDTGSSYLTSPAVLTNKSPKRWLLQIGSKPVASPSLQFQLVTKAKPIE